MTNDVAVALRQGQSPEFPDESHDGNEQVSQTWGYLYMLCSAVCHSFMTFFIRVAESKYAYPSICALMIRSCTSIGLSLLYLSVHGLFHALVLPMKQLTLLGLRGVAGALTGYFTFLALSYLNVGTTITILYASPAITSVLSTVFLGDPFTFLHAITLALNFTGIVLVSHEPSTPFFTPELPSAGVLYAIIAAIFTSIVFLLARVMGFRVHFVLGVLSYGISSAVISIILGSREDVSTVFSNDMGTVFALLSGCAGFGSQSMLNRALQRVSPGPGAVVRSINVPLTFTLGLLFLNEHISVVCLTGVILVLTSIGSVAWRKHRDDQRRLNSPAQLNSDSS